MLRILLQTFLFEIKRSKIVKIQMLNIRFFLLLM